MVLIAVDLSAPDGERLNARCAVRRCCPLLRRTNCFCIPRLLMGQHTLLQNPFCVARRHSEDVLVYAGMIAQSLGLPAKEVTTLRAATLLHDVGKIGVASRILRLPTRLSNEEYDAIKQRAALGAALVESLLRHSGDSTKVAVDREGVTSAVRHHHEAWDGSGYPDGLVGEAIPFLARVLAVADSYSALTTDRPYRKGRSREEVLEVLRAGAGKQWDVHCVRAFLDAQPAPL